MIARALGGSRLQRRSPTNLAEVLWAVVEYEVTALSRT
jgi:hypothetical protein